MPQSGIVHVCCMPCSRDHRHSVVGEQFQMSVGRFPETFISLSVDYSCWYLENGGRKRDREETSE